MGGRRLVATFGAAILSATCVLGLSGGSAAATQPAPSYPVVWNFLLTAALAGAQNGPDVPPPGANVPCTMSATHPYPVVLVHGLGGDQNDNWQTLSPFLADAGYCVYSLTYGNNTTESRPFDQFGGMADMVQSAQQLSTFVQQVLATTGARKVDLVGHSEGGTMPDYYLKFDGGATYVNTFVALSGVMHGTTMWGLDSLEQLGQSYGYSQQFSAGMAQYCASCLEFLPESGFMQSLDSTSAPGAASVCASDGADVLGVQYTSIATDYDELVRPPTSDFLDPACGNTHNYLVQDQCPTDFADHLAIVADPVAVQDVLRGLDPTYDAPDVCTLVLPGFGPLVPPPNAALLPGVG